VVIYFYLSFHIHCHCSIELADLFLIIPDARRTAEAGRIKAEKELSDANAAAAVAAASISAHSSEKERNQKEMIKERKKAEKAASSAAAGLTQRDRMIAELQHSLSITEQQLTGVKEAVDYY
jgi:type III secretory pathway component EscV